MGQRLRQQHFLDLAIYAVHGVLVQSFLLDSLLHMVTFHQPSTDNRSNFCLLAFARNHDLNF